MRTILSLDSAGRIIIPKAIREKLHLGPGTSLQVEVIGDRIELTQVLPEIRLEKKGKRRVVVGTGSFDAVDAVAESREEYVSRLDKPRSK
ncbi:MAG: Bifunctional DNA-binding transcriptional regulator of the YhaV-PrlF toxin-antitoxin module [Verrucomicrobia bacterium]|jgi:AbrB family looped-hinge helix DNA binding protein|nr:MAG: Bifunctional DNA-binding transcriptional regulator of the YhaV-PrlF toxin-antitoxin module [Verrucomicrobiota bacterium]